MRTTLNRPNQSDVDSINLTVNLINPSRAVKPVQRDFPPASSDLPCQNCTAWYPCDTHRFLHSPPAELEPIERGRRGAMPRLRPQRQASREIHPGPRNPPRLAVRTLVATSVAIGLVLVAVFVVLSMDAQRRITGTAFDTLDSAQRIFGELEQQRQQDVLLKLNALAENPGLTAAGQLSQRRGRPPQRSSNANSTDWPASSQPMPWSSPTTTTTSSPAPVPRRAAWLPSTTYTNTDTFVGGSGTVHPMFLMQLMCRRCRRRESNPHWRRSKRRLSACWSTPADRRPQWGRTVRRKDTEAGARTVRALPVPQPQTLRSLRSLATWPVARTLYCASRSSLRRRRRTSSG